jgi:hypothetical protein
VVSISLLISSSSRRRPPPFTFPDVEFVALAIMTYWVPDVRNLAQVGHVSNIRILIKLAERTHSKSQIHVYIISTVYQTYPDVEFVALAIMTYWVPDVRNLAQVAVLLKHSNTSSKSLSSISNISNPCV